MFTVVLLISDFTLSPHLFFVRSALHLIVARSYVQVHSFGTGSFSTFAIRTIRTFSDPIVYRMCEAWCEVTRRAIPELGSCCVSGYVAVLDLVTGGQ